MHEDTYEEMMNEIKNRMMTLGHEITASDSMSLGLKLGKVVYTDDSFSHATLDQLMSGITNFIASYIISRNEFIDMTSDKKREFIKQFMDRMSIMFALTQVAGDEMHKRKNIVNQSKCDHIGHLVDYILNDGYWVCLKCKEKIKKHVKKDWQFE